jgi:hypothetical protein
VRVTGEEALLALSRADDIAGKPYSVLPAQPGNTTTTFFWPSVTMPRVLIRIAWVSTYTCPLLKYRQRFSALPSLPCLALAGETSVCNRPKSTLTAGKRSLGMFHKRIY